DQNQQVTIPRRPGRRDEEIAVEIAAARRRTRPHAPPGGACCWKFSSRVRAREKPQLVNRFVRLNDQLKYFPCILIMLNLSNIQMPPCRELDHPVVPQASIVAQFRDYRPEKFSGQGDPRIVDEWVQGLELIFEVMDCPDRYRVTCAQLQLTGDARLWWNAYWSMRPGEKEDCTWERFKKMIREKYYPTYYRAEMERQFLSLKQGTRSVDEYDREFTRLGAFVPDL
ncbi:Unknown protein, partial [Striga hermonthica]